MDIYRLISKVNQRLGLLRRIKRPLPFKTRLLFYNSLVLQLFDYAGNVWGDKNNPTLVNSVQVLQKKAVKIILDKPVYSSSSEALATINWITLKQRRFYHRCVYVYKYVHDHTNHSMDLVTYGDVHNYNTRNKD